jgi:DNA mismatch endonuclease (patch repair protein)
MSKIRSKNTSPEITLRKIIRGSGIKGYRLHYKVVGRPDIAFTRLKLAIFIDGCFWHGCPRHFRMPSSNKAYWSRKIGKNRRRDRKNTLKLRKAGWKVLRFWEHEIRECAVDCAREIVKTVKNRLNKA